MRHGVVDAAGLKRMLHDGGEIALLDVREEGVFAKGHLLLAAPAPLSQLEIRAPLLVPRRSARVVLMDAGEGLAERAATVLVRHGYTDVAVLQRGLQAWIDAGYEIYTGVNVPSKAFGEYVEHHDQTPRVDPAEVKAMVDRGDDLVILDSRPLDEYRSVSIPGAIDCPGAELAYRVHDLVRSGDTLVVVNCGGRTRSIIGAQSLRNAGIPNPVVALKNGTMGWHLAGFPVDHGKERTAPPPTADGLAKALQAAARVARRFGVRYLDAAGLDAFRREADARTLYLLDVRSPEEYAQSHLRGSVSAPGGQLVQSTDAYAAVRNARLVLIDDHGVRATMTASWLLQMGWDEVYVLRDALRYGEWVAGPQQAAVLGLDAIHCRTLPPQALQARGDEVSVLDLDAKPRYKAGHIPGAWHGIRANLAANLGRLPAGRPIVATSADGVLARLAVPEIEALTGIAAYALEGGTQAWRAAGLPLEQGETRLTDDTDDVWVKVHDRAGNRDQAMKDYLSWEVDLLTQIGRDDDARFRRFPAAQQGPTTKETA
ncbi:rhodanese homology domain-containing protein [Pigmentiphaga soli]|uniref:Rhodanese homology domain-containing protein n=1 Tax=Pigmentiphaga soli TaxID=1007095 RepID=A0ABP8GDN2_9BURK